MKRYQVTSRMVTLSMGIVALSDDQAAPRMHNLKKVGKGKYEIVKPIHFKNGEEIGYEGQISKTMAMDLEEAAKVKAAKKKAQEEEHATAKKAAEDEAKRQADIEAKAKVEWEKDETLRGNYEDNFDAFLEDFRADVENGFEKVAG